MKNALRLLALAFAALAGFSFSTPASAVAVLVDPADFSIVEGPGQYTVSNHSSSWYIYGFGVSNPSAANLGASASTDFSNWSGHVLTLDFGSGAIPAFGYASADANLANINNPFLTSVDLSHYIGPGGTSDRFFFTGAQASVFGMLLVNLNGIETTINGVTSDVSATPLPAALPLFASGGALLGFLGWRRKRKLVSG
jgi:hypothetical protein